LTVVEVRQEGDKATLVIKGPAFLSDQSGGAVSPRLIGGRAAVRIRRPEASSQCRAALTEFAYEILLITIALIVIVFHDHAP
jgi:hypothetical protein